jgi:Dodecin
MSPSLVAILNSVNNRGSIAKIIEIVGSSDKGWQDAAQVGDMTQFLGSSQTI